MKAKLNRALKYILHGVPTVEVKVSVHQLTPNAVLKDKKIIITGGGKGLGFEMAKKCISEGAEVLITGRDLVVLKKASAQLNNCAYLELDLQNIESFEQFIKQADHILGGQINALVNNAGVSLHEGNYSKVTPIDFEIQFNTNLKGPYFLTNAFVNYLMHNQIKNGNILFISSERGLYGDDVPYGLTKAALNSFTEGLARRLIKNGIRVNGVAPGVTASNMTGYQKDSNLYRPKASGGRVFLPEEVAELVSFLLSNVSNSISGEVIACNQGNHLRCDW